MLWGMTTPLIAFIAALAGLSAAAMLWFGSDLVYKLQYTMKQRARAKKAAAQGSVKAEEKGKGKEKPAKK